MAFDPPNWTKSLQESTAAFPGMLPPSQSTNIYEKQIESGNPDAYAYNQQVYSYIIERGLPILYYPYLYDITKNEQLTGEHSAATYGKPFKTYALLEIKDAPSWVESHYGFNNNDQFNATIHIQQFKETIRGILLDPSDERSKPYAIKYNPNYEEEEDWVHAIEPSPKDLIQLMLYGTDREKPRGNRIFEVNGKEDEVLSQNYNNYFGHYVWKLTGTRYRYSYEDNLSSIDVLNDENTFIGEMGEKGNYQVFDNMPVAKMFMVDNNIITEDGITEGTEGTGTVNIAIENTQDKIIQKYSKIYGDGIDIAEQSKQEFDLSRNIEGIYAEPAGPKEEKPPIPGLDAHIDTNGFL